jgi:hypothetical protein
MKGWRQNEECVEAAKDEPGGLYLRADADAVPEPPPS